MNFSFIIVEFPFHAEKKKFIDRRLRKSVFLPQSWKRGCFPTLGGLEFFNITFEFIEKHLNTSVFRCGNNNSQEKTKNKTLVDRKQLILRDMLQKLLMLTSGGESICFNKSKVAFSIQTFSLTTNSEIVKCECVTSIHNTHAYVILLYVTVIRLIIVL